ncbi:hypothetical protein ACOMHN_065495 [Nucella lapillus]
MSVNVSLISHHSIRFLKQYLFKDCVCVCWADSSAQEAAGATGKDDEIPDSPTNDEFVSDIYNQQELTEEDVRKEMEQLGVKDGTKEAELDEWEKELQQELQDYEMVRGTEDMEEDPDLEREILQQIEDEEGTTATAPGATSHH